MKGLSKRFVESLFITIHIFSNDYYCLFRFCLFSLFRTYCYYLFRMARSSQGTHTHTDMYRLLANGNHAQFIFSLAFNCNLHIDL